MHRNEAGFEELRTVDSQYAFRPIDVLGLEPRRLTDAHAGHRQKSEDRVQGPRLEVVSCHAPHGAQVSDLRAWRPLLLLGRKLECEGRSNVRSPFFIQEREEASQPGLKPIQLVPKIAPQLEVFRQGVGQ
jgi:hypothetical protein